MGGVTCDHYHGPRALRVAALVDLRIGISELDRDVPLQLVLEAHRLHARQGLDHGGLAVRDVTDRAWCARNRDTEPMKATDLAQRTDVDGGLAADDLGRERRQRRGVQARRVLPRKAVLRAGRA